MTKQVCDDDDDVTTWREQISDAMEYWRDTWEDVVGMFPADDGWLDVRFNKAYGGTEGRPFTLWTKDRVYFPACYDGMEWCSSVPRNPCAHATRHVGGG